MSVLLAAATTAEARRSRRAALVALRLVVLGQVVVLSVQAFLGGLALDGSPRALAAHRANGMLGLALALLLVPLALAVRREDHGTRSLPYASAVVLAAEAVQMGSGHWHVLALHLPLGLATFGVVAWLSLSAGIARPSAQSSERPRRRVPGSERGRPPRVGSEAEVGTVSGGNL